MDTRTKIVSPEQARELVCELRRTGRRIKVVTGYFDVLQADHVRALRQIVDGAENPALLVVLSPPPQPVLSARARAEMVAALAMVDYVVTAKDDKVESLLAIFQAGEIVRGEAGDVRRMQQLIQHVHQRQAG